MGRRGMERKLITLKVPLRVLELVDHEARVRGLTRTELLLERWLVERPKVEKRHWGMV